MPMFHILQQAISIKKGSGLKWQFLNPIWLVGGWDFNMVLLSAGVDFRDIAEQLGVLWFHRDSHAGRNDWWQWWGMQDSSSEWPGW